MTGQEVRGENVVFVHMFRVTQVQQEVLGYQDWMDVTEPEALRDWTDFLERMDQMEHRSDQSIHQSINQPIYQSISV